MKTLLTISRIIVGILFIFSGLIKANDPLGLSYKMQEFFEVWGWHFLNDYTLALSVIMIAFEIIAGVAVLLGWKMKLFSWLLLALIIFFTFLTAYALFSGKIRECGCFGDCIPLQAGQSFAKDLLLLALIGFIFIYRDKIRSSLASRRAMLILFFTAIFSFALQWHALLHLPIVDCLPYKIGNNIPEKMKAPPGAIPDSTVIVFTYEKSGKPVSFTADNFPEDFDDSYVFVKREDKVVRKGNAQAAIRDFSLQSPSGNDTTLALLNENREQLFLFVKDGYAKGSWTEALNITLTQAEKKGIPAFLVTNLPIDEIMNNGPEAFRRLTPLRSDGTAIKTAARYNPTLFLIRGGTIIHKWSALDLDQALKALQQMP
ncbi:MAG: DoxX family protein [Chitinophagaceae bacterium]|nr:DoxX family protein [Chitinophagaceae bacterium]